MITFWNQLGVIRWPLLFSLLMVSGLGVWMALRLFVFGKTADLRTKAWVDAILFWGGFAVVAGVLGTLVGMSLAAHFIEGASTVNPSLVWGGMRVAMSSSVLGLVIMAWASLLWFVLQLRWRLLEADALEA